MTHTWNSSSSFLRVSFPVPPSISTLCTLPFPTHLLLLTCLAFFLIVSSCLHSWLFRGCGPSHHIAVVRSLVWHMYWVFVVVCIHRLKTKPWKSKMCIWVKADKIKNVYFNCWLYLNLNVPHAVSWKPSQYWPCSQRSLAINRRKPCRIRLYSLLDFGSGWLLYHNINYRSLLPNM